jgi:demethylmenaquinone methyltransferase / 2-methoxy-6-polyprenyl-1,4-benzoquinol methylase
MDKAQKMRRLFSGAPTEYDRLLSRLTLRSDSEWRRGVIESSRLGKEAFVLDVATGTGLMAFDFARELNDPSMVIGVDLCIPMVKRGVARTEQNGKGIVSFVAACAEALPFVDGFFDCAAITLALRNVSDPKATFEEMTRVVKAGGSVISMDFCRPQGLFRFIYYIHISYILPFIGWLVSSEWKAIFDYLAGSIKRSLDPENIGNLMGIAGLTSVKIRRMSRCIVSVVTGWKST